MSESQTKVSVYQNGKLIREHMLSPGEYVVGKDGAVERCESGKTQDGLKLSLNGEQSLVEDLGSLDRTLVDGDTITVPTIIMPGQIIRHGNREIVIGSGAATADSFPEETRPEVSVRQPSVEEIRNPGRYGMVRRVGRGGMGVVMSARDVILQREVAMKLMLDGAKPESVARFYQEAQITAQLEHPNIVPVHALDLNEKDQPFYTMKLVRGVSLKRVLERLANEDPVVIRKWPLSALLTVYQKVCDAIAFAHARGVIHRDLKPDNIMLGEYGEAQVMDWGLAKLLGQESATGVHRPVTEADVAPATNGEKTTMGGTMSGTVIGTPQYMSPEQANGAVEQMDERTDIYSLGAILYQILALRAPFNGHNSDEVLRNVREGRAVPLAEAGMRKRLPHLPGGRMPASLVAVTQKAMSLLKTQRYPAVKILQSEIQAYQNGFAPLAEEASMWKLASLFFRRHRTVSLAALAILFSLLVFGFNLKRERDRATSARQTADEQRNAAEDQLYRSEMLQAGRHLADGRPESARDLLSRHHIETSGRDLRGWEWFYLLGEANQDRLRVQAHRGGIFALAATADGTRLATGGGDGDIAVWQARGLVPEFRLHISTGAVLTVDWHAGGRWLATGSADGLVQVWDVETRNSVAEFRLDSESSLRSVRWRPGQADPPTLVIGSSAKEILVWRPLAGGQAGGPQTFVTAHGGVAAMHWSADGKLLASAELDTMDTIEVFNFDSKKRVLSANTTSGNDAFTIAIDPTGKYVAAGSKHLLVVVYDLQASNTTLVSAEALHRGFVSALAWSPDGKRLASASHDGTIRLSSPVASKNPTMENEPVEILSGHRGEINALVWTALPPPAGSQTRTMALFSGGADGTLRAWVSQPGKVFTFKEYNWIASANWEPGGTRLAIANFRGNVYLSDPATGVSLPLHSVHGNIFDVAWSPNGDRLATASRNTHRIETFDSASGRPLGIFSLASAYRVAWSPSGRYIAACGPEGVRVWDTRTDELMVVISRPAGCMVWHPDERQIILGGKDGAIEIWNAFTGKKAATWRAAATASTGSVTSDTDPPRQVFDLRWSPDGRFLAFATQDSLAGLLDAREGRLVRTFAGHTGGIWRVVWNPDSRRLATVGQDGMLRIYDAVAGGQVAHIPHGLGNTELHALDWSRDGRFLVSGGYDRVVRLWDAQRGEQIDAVEQMGPQVRADTDLVILKSLLRTYAQLGWADDARETYRAAQLLAPEDAELNADVAEAEAFFARALDAESAGIAPPFSQIAAASPLLSRIHYSWEAGRAEAAVKAWRELALRPGSEGPLAYARTCMSRARWSAKWFESKVDPLADLDEWRAQAAASEAVALNIRLLSFPYLRRGPKDLLLDRELTERGAGAKDFGMIAQARVNLSAGKWLFRATGGDGVRVLVNGYPVIDKWADDAPPEKSGEYKQEATGSVEITVEHFVRNPTDGFQFQIEPVAD